MKKTIVFLLFCSSLTSPFKTIAQTIDYINYNNSSVVIPTLNLQYGTNAFWNVLDLYYNNDNTIKPLIVIVPGSGFTYNQGTNPRSILDDTKLVAMNYAKRGYIAAVVNYHRVSDPCQEQMIGGVDRFFEGVVAKASADVHAAIQYLVYNKTAFKINHNNIFFVGQSAGGFAVMPAVWWSTTKFNAEFTDLACTKTMFSKYPSIVYNIKGIALESSAMHTPRVFTEADQNNTIPIIMTQSIEDPTVPFTTGFSNLCPTKPNTFAGTGSIKNIIDNDPLINNYYKMFQINCTRHNTFNFRNDVNEINQSTLYLLDSTASFFSPIILQTLNQSLISKTYTLSTPECPDYETEIYTNNMLKQVTPGAYANKYTYSNSNNFPYDKLDVYYVDDHNPKALLILLHSGEFASTVGSYDVRNTLKDAAMSYARKGYVVAVMDYYRTTTCSIPFDKIIAKSSAGIHAAIQFLIAKTPTFSIDKNYIFIHGEALGGLAATTALWWSNDRYLEEFGKYPGFKKDMYSISPNEEYSIKAISLISSGIAKPEVLLNSDINVNVPMIMYHSNQDSFYPFKCGNTVCGISTISGPGYIRDAINNSSQLDNYNVVFEYNCNQHSLSSLLGPSIHTVNSAFYANVVFNRPRVNSPNPITIYPTCAYSLPVTYPSCSLSYSKIGNSIEDNITTPISDNTFNAFVKNKELIISFNSENTEVAAMKLYNLSGSLKKQTIITSGKHINIEELQTGIYFVLVEQNNTVYKKKIFIE